MKKATYIRKYPGLSPEALSAKAKEMGLDISPNYVMNIRYLDKLKQKAKRRERKSANGHAPVETTPATDSPNTDAFGAVGTIMETLKPMKPADRRRVVDAVRSLL